MPSVPKEKQQLIPGPPAEDLSALVTRLWSETLGTTLVPGVSLLDQGGDSLLATRLALRLGEALATRVPIRTVLEHPTPEALASALGKLQASTRVIPAPPRHSSKNQGTTLSFSQERMWFMHAIAPQSIAYNISLTLRLRGQLDARALGAALDIVVQRHPVLHGNYVSRANGVASIIHSYRTPALTQTCLPATTDPLETDQLLRDHLSRLVNRPFDLATDPLIRAELVHLAEADALLVFLVHHIIGDQWSFDVLSRELAEYYNAIIAGGEARLSEPLVEYNHYAAWHRQWFKQAREAKELAYWLDRLDGLEPTTFNPDHPRPPQKSFRGARLHLPLDPELASALRTMGAASGATLAMVLLAVLKVLLHRHAGSNDIGIGVPIANRHHPGSEELVGTLLNTLVLRTDLKGDPDFRTVLERVRDACLDAYEHQDMPFEQLVQALRLPRDPSRSPLFGVMFNMLNTPLGELEFTGLKWSRFEFDRHAAQFDLTVTVDADHDRSIVFEYATDLYASDTITRIATQYMSLLHAIVDAPATCISALPINSTEDLARLKAWGTGLESALEHETLAALLRPAFSAHTHRTALSCGAETLDYQELGGHVDALARRLRAWGIGRGSRVGICLDRSARLLIAPLAVVHAGGAWVPLDPSCPTERLVFMAQDAGLDLLITESALAGQVPWPIDATLLLDVLPAIAETGGADGWDNTMDAGPEDPAYLIYTSGSTGLPKGVVIPHRAVCNFLASMGREPGIGPEDRLLAVTTFGFDIAVLELLLPFTVGAQVVLARQPALTDGKQLRELLERHAATMMQATPSTWRMLIETGWTGVTGFRALVGGESLPPDLAIALLTRCTEAWNMYGPTETTVWSSCWRIDDSALEGRISLGSPIENTRIHVLDAYDQPCPIGAPGELCIGGAGLATGYHNRPELVQQQFFSDPFSQSPGERLYRTGDRVRWLHDGHLQHMGRLDFQVKIRGHRIELGEIEARLAQHPKLAGSVVIAREDRPGDVRLVAYSVPWEKMPTPAALRAFLREKLPEYMVPQRFVELDAIPVLPNGKINRSGLPAASAHLVGGSPPIPPRTPLEHQLWQLWQEVLGIDHFGVEDNFFDLGGHSMLAVQLVGRIRDHLAVHCTVPVLFLNPTISQLGQAINAPHGSDPGSAVVPLQPQGEHAPLFCLCGVHLYRDMAEHFAPDWPVYGVHIAEETAFLETGGNADVNALDVIRMAASYCDSIRAHQPDGPYHLVGFSFGGVLAFEVAQQLRAAGQKVALLAIIDSDVPGSVRDGVPFRIRRRLRRLLSPKRHRRNTTLDSDNSEALSNVAFERTHGYLAAMRNYEADQFPGEIVFFEACFEADYTPYGWDRLAARLEVHQLQGDHLGILRPPTVGQLAEILKAKLASTRSSPPVAY